MAPDADLLQHPHVSSARSQECKACDRPVSPVAPHTGRSNRSDRTNPCARKSRRHLIQSVAATIADVGVSSACGALHTPEFAKREYHNPERRSQQMTEVRGGIPKTCEPRERVCDAGDKDAVKLARPYLIDPFTNIVPSSIGPTTDGIRSCSRHEFAAEGYESQRNSNAKANSVNALLFSVLIQPIFQPTRIQCSDPLANDSTDAAVSCCK